MPTLEILSGEQAGKTYPFSGEIQIGKDPGCQVTLSDPGVSRYHAKISASGAGLQIEDLGSSNGTYVNFKKFGKGERSPLNDKDVVFFGRTVAKYWATAPSSAGGGVPVQLLRETVPLKGLTCTKCHHGLEADLRAKVQEQERVEVIRRLRLHQLDEAALGRLLAQARG